MTRALLAALAAFVTASLVSPLHSSGPFHLGGFLSAGYLKSSSYNYLANTDSGASEFLELGLWASWAPYDRTSIKAQLFAFELGPYGNYDPQIDFLFIDLSASEALGLRLGRVKRPNGLYTESLNIDVARYNILPPSGIYDPRFRDFAAFVDGISLYGSLFPSESQFFEYSLYAGYKSMDSSGGIAGATHTLLSHQFTDVSVLDIDSKYNLGGQLWWNTPVENLRLGISYSHFPDVWIASEGRYPDHFANPAMAGLLLCGTVETDISTQHLSLSYFVDRWTLAAEAYQQRRDSLQTRWIEGGAPQSAHHLARADGWFISLSRRFLDRFEAGTAYTEYYTDADNRRGQGLPAPHSAYSRDWQLSFEASISSQLSLKLEYHEIEGTGLLFNQFGQNAELPERVWQLWALKISLSF